ncbi:response regulator transcription factor [Staphylococcus sp. 11261D007BR]
MKALIIEDDIEIAHILSLMLARENIRSVIAYSGEEGISVFEEVQFDIILLDLMLPQLSGQEVLDYIRQKSNDKVIVISAKNDVKEKVALLSAGADDYITKPFDQEEVLARVFVQLRNVHPDDTNEVKKWKALEVDVSKREVTLETQPVPLTNIEYDIIKYFISHPEKPLSKQQIYEQLWTGPYLGDDNTVSMHMSNIRKKFSKITQEPYFKTVWGIGFMLI